MALTYQEFIANLNNQGLAQQNFIDYANQYSIPVTYNPELNRLLVNGVPINIANSGLTDQNGQLFGTEQQYQNIIAPATQNAYAGQEQQLIDEAQGFQPYQTPEFIQNFIQQMIQRQQQPFEYNPETDPSVIAARQQLQQSVADMAAKRGFLYGTPQQDIVASQFQKLTPMFEDVAYKKEQDFLNRQLSLGGVIMQWDQMQADRRVDDRQLWQMKADFILKLEQRDLEQFKLMLDQRREQMAYELEKQRVEMKKKQQELDIAYKKLDTLGYADNEVSRIIGVKPGTEAQWVKQAALQQKMELQRMNEKYKYDLKLLKQNAMVEKELFAYKNKLELESTLKLMEKEYNYDVKLTEQQFKYDEEIRKIKEAQAKAEQAAAEAEAAKQAEKAQKEAIASQLKDEEMKLEYDYALKLFKQKLGDGLKGGLITDSHKQSAAYILIEMAREGISDSTLNKIEAIYRIPAYDGPIGPPTPQQSAAGVGW